jgi:C4-dicarboxylate-specific signal transduction histidine kinase
MLTSLSEQIAIVDRSGFIIAVNDTWSRYARESADDRFPRVAVGTNYLDACRGAGNDAGAARAAQGIAAVLDGSEVGLHLEYDCSCSAAPRWFEFSAIPLRRPEGGAVVSHRDITRRKRAEMEAEVQRQELTHLTRVGILGQLSGALAHELNQPLTAILSNAQAVQRLLAREPLDLAELRIALSDIVEADKRAGDVIARLRSLLKKGEGDFYPLDPNGVVNEVLELAHSDLVVRGVAVNCRLAQGIPAVRGDRVQLQQLLLNLIANACEAMSDTKRNERALTITTALADNRTIRIGIADTGYGIATDVQDRIFEPFVTTKKQGLGLGLAICRSIVRAHGGFIQAIKNSDRGSTFYVTLPIHG